MRLMGIDPGSQITGYGVLEITDGEIQPIAHGVLRSLSQRSFLERLPDLDSQLQQVFELYKPEVTVIERIFMGKNVDSAFKLGHVRGLCIVAAQRAQSEIVEYAARSVKKGVTGNGAATKEQVQMVLFTILGIQQQALLDASDALALAYYHGRQMEVASRLQKGARRRLESAL